MSERDKPHPVDVIGHAKDKIAFLADAVFTDNFEFSITGQHGLYLLLRDIEGELKESEDRLTEMTFCNRCNGQQRGEL